VRAVSPHLTTEYSDMPNGSSRLSRTNWIARIATRPDPAPECDEVAVTRVSTGASFVVEDRVDPITPV
jgi:hypothetical protein